jgi:hypothetical protein
LSKLLNIATRVESVQCSLYRLRIPQYAVRARHCICYIAHFPSPSSRNPIARRCSNYREKDLLAQSGVIPCRVKHWCGRARGSVCTRISRRRNGEKRRKRRLPESPGEAQRRLRANSGGTRSFGMHCFYMVSSCFAFCPQGLHFAKDFPLMRRTSSST